MLEKVLSKLYSIISADGHSICCFDVIVDTVTPFHHMTA